MELQHVWLADPPPVLIVCSECGHGHYAESSEVHEWAGTVYLCTWADCESDGVTTHDIQLNWEFEEELCFVRTEAGLCLAYRPLRPE